MKEQKRTSFTQFVLEKVVEAGELYVDAFLPRQYAHARFTRALIGLDSYPRKSRPTVNALLWRLQKQGLVECSGRRGSFVWSPTAAGKKLQAEKNTHRLSKKPDGITRLVIFDIPEYERKKRTAVRVELFAHDFRQLQKSVWIGTVPLSKDFIGLLDELDLHGKVHIFSVRAEGTLQKLI